jgi:ABC-type microcin C transport system permease subunit YejB
LEDEKKFYMACNSFYYDVAGIIIPLPEGVVAEMNESTRFWLWLSGCIVIALIVVAWYFMITMSIGKGGQKLIESQTRYIEQLEKELGR